MTYVRATAAPASPSITSATATATGRGRCCSCTASANARRRAAPSWTDPWPGPVVGLDFVGHGASSIPNGGGYSAEILLADADTALRHLGEVTVAGRGLGAYIALLARRGPARARARRASSSTGPAPSARSLGPGLLDPAAPSTTSPSPRPTRSRSPS